MDCLGLAGLRHQRDGNAAPHGRGADLCPALFTLVGIAGEDDLDAPDLMAPTAPSSKAEQPGGNKNGHLNGGQRNASRKFARGRQTKVDSNPPKPTLEPGPSATLCDQLLIDLEEITSAEEAANWAHRVLGAKNTLTTADAERVEHAFQARLATFSADAADGPLMLQDAKSPVPRPDRTKKRRPAAVIDKSVLALPTLRRVRDRDHVRLVAKQPCLICGRRPADAHHLRFAQSRALGRKVSDEFTVPLCRGNHREVHRCGDEAAWWRQAGIDPIVSARVLWLQSHPLPTEC